MTNIKIGKLQPTESEFIELSNLEMNDIKGGWLNLFRSLLTRSYSLATPSSYFYSPSWDWLKNFDISKAV